VLRIRWRLLTGFDAVCATTANSKISAKRATKPCFFPRSPTTHLCVSSNRYHAYLSHRLSGSIRKTNYRTKRPNTWLHRPSLRRDSATFAGTAKGVCSTERRCRPHAGGRRSIWLVVLRLYEVKFLRTGDGKDRPLSPRSREYLTEREVERSGRRLVPGWANGNVSPGRKRRAGALTSRTRAAPYDPHPGATPQPGEIGASDG
jgi:hypothetical protein